jgi:hypothetical protein
MQWAANFLCFHKYSILKRKEANRAQVTVQALIQKSEQNRGVECGGGGGRGGVLYEPLWGLVLIAWLNSKRA